jgi:hypothetical protein
MNTYRVFYRRFRLSAKEEAKLREYHQKRHEQTGQVTIRYTKTKRIKDVEASSFRAASSVVVTDEYQLLEDLPDIRKQYAVVYGVIAKPECVRHKGAIETFSAEEMLLL